MFHRNGKKNKFDKVTDKLAEVNDKSRNCRITVHYCERPRSRFKFSSLSSKNTLIKLKVLFQKTSPFMEYDIYFIFNFLMIG